MKNITENTRTAEHIKVYRELARLVAQGVRLRPMLFFKGYSQFLFKEVGYSFLQACIRTFLKEGAAETYTPVGFDVWCSRCDFGIGHVGTSGMGDDAKTVHETAAKHFIQTDHPVMLYHAGDLYTLSDFFKRFIDGKATESQ